MKSEPGTYALILKCKSNDTVQIGRLGQIELRPGYYIYIGSAFGPGGIKARVERHWRVDKRKHWHIDYLREYVTPVKAWVSYETERLEHEWAQILFDMPEMTPIQGFGCSDCGCYSHLFYLPKPPDLSSFTIGITQFAIKVPISDLEVVHENS